VRLDVRAQAACGRGALGSIDYEGGLWPLTASTDVIVVQMRQHYARHVRWFGAPLADLLTDVSLGKPMLDRHLPEEEPNVRVGSDPIEGS
jgi:hypothetical protein